MYGAKAYAFDFQGYFTSDEAEEYEPIFLEPNKEPRPADIRL